MSATPPGELGWNDPNFNEKNQEIKVLISAHLK